MEIKITSQFGENTFNLIPEDIMTLVSTAFQFSMKNMGQKPYLPKTQGILIPKEDTEKSMSEIQKPQEPDKSWGNLLTEAAIKAGFSKKGGETEDEKRAWEGYSGFLHIKCESCGNVHTYCPKEKIKYHKCRCGHTTRLQDLKLLYAECKCGKRSRYHTNITDNTTTVNCVNCGSPIDITWNERRNSYATLKDAKHHVAAPRSTRRK
jgi:ribosomal protein S27E